MEHTHPELLATADVARIIDRTPATVRDLARRRVLIPAAVTPHGVRLYARADVERYVAERDHHNQRTAAA